MLLCPVAPVPAIVHDQSEPASERVITVNGATRPYGDLLGWIGLATMALLPATVVPVGRTPEGLPVGLQIIGPYLEDYTPLDVAAYMSERVYDFEPPSAFVSDPS